MCESPSAFAGEQLSEGQPGAVIDGDVQIFPAEPASDAAFTALIAAITGNTMADPIDAAKLLDVDMDQFAGPLAFVVDGLRPRPRPRSTTPIVKSAGMSRPAGFDVTELTPLRCAKIPGRLCRGYQKQMHRVVSCCPHCLALATTK